MNEPMEIVSRAELFKRIAPFVGIGVAGSWASSLLPGTFDTEVALFAFALTVVLVVNAVLAPWGRLPLWTQAVTPLLFLAVVALTRDASGGASSGLGSLVLLPIIWFALYGTRTQMTLGVIGVAAVFLVPVVFIGGTEYPAQEWVRGGMWALIAAVVGYTMQELVNNQRRQSGLLRDRAAELKASTELFEGTLSAATEYSIIGIDPEGVITVFNAGAERMLGYTAEEMIGRQSPVILHDEAEVVERAAELGVEPGLAVFTIKAVQGENETRRWTYLTKTGRRIPVELTTSAIREAGGAITGFIGIASDISERLRAEVALKASEGALFAVSRVSKEIANSHDARQSICDAAREVCGADIAVLMEPEGSNRLAMTASSGVDLPAITLRLDAESSGSGTAFLTGERLFVPDAGDNASVSARVNNVLNAQSVLFEPVRRDGQTVGTLTIAWKECIPELSALVDNAARLLASDAGVAIERSDLVKRLEGAALTDALTGLGNRRAWDEELPRALKTAANSGRQVAIAIFDLDHFKNYNDTHGHQAGDRLLVEVSAAWRDQLRDGDVLARYGGEEFALLLPDTSPGDAVRVAERIRRAAPAAITCSAGLAIVESGESGDAAVARADAALYEAKAKGRNTLLEYSETEAWAERHRVAQS